MNYKELHYNLLILLGYWAEFSDITINYQIQGFKILQKLSTYLMSLIKNQK